MRYRCLWGLYYVRIHPSNFLEQVKSDCCVTFWGVDIFRLWIAFHGGWCDLLRLLSAIVASHKSVLLCFPHLSCKEFYCPVNPIHLASHTQGYIVSATKIQIMYFMASSSFEGAQNGSAFLLCLLRSLKLRWADSCEVPAVLSRTLEGAS